MNKMEQSFEELAQENSELRNTIKELRSDKSDLQDDLDEARSDLEYERTEKEEAQEELERIRETNDNLSSKFNEAFEYYHTIWLDETKDQQLITRMKEIYAEFK